MIRAEEIKKILSGLAIDFVEGCSKTREVYLYEEDVNCGIDGGDVTPLSANRAIKITFEYTDRPKSEPVYDHD